MVSEDSQHLRWLPMVHRLNDLRDLNETWHRKVRSELDQPTNLDELCEVLSLRSSQWVRFEERDDLVAQVPESEDLVRTEILAMVVVSAVDIHLAATEEHHHRIENVPARLALNHDKCWLHLPAEAHRAVLEDRAAEAAFPIDETHQPIVGEESFLLIVRTGWIFTAHAFTLKIG